VVPNGELVDALRAEKLLAVAAGENVVRLLPPLIIEEAEIAEGVARLDRAASAIERAAAAKAVKEAATLAIPRSAISSTSSTFRRRSCAASSRRAAR